MERENLVEPKAAAETEGNRPTALQKIPASVRGTLLWNRRGSEYIQNLAIIGFFVIAVFVAIGALADAVEAKFTEQAAAVGTIPGG